MSDQETDRQFRQIIDSFIHLANQHLDVHKPENVGLALLYAAARFNSFVVAAHAPEINTFNAERPAAVDFFSREYLRMLNENLDDYRKIHEGPGKYAHLMSKQ